MARWILGVMMVCGLALLLACGGQPQQRPAPKKRTVSQELPAKKAKAPAKAEEKPTSETQREPLTAPRPEFEEPEESPK